MASIKLLIVLALVVASVFAKVPRVVYNGDSRQDFYQVSSALQSEGDSVAIIIGGGSSSLSLNADNTYTVTSASSAQATWGLCPEEAFADQLIITGAGYCSGFLISTNPPWLATAGHCIFGPATLSSTVVIFGFDQTSAQAARTTFPANDVYFISGVVAQGPNQNDGNDYGVYLLDRPVVGKSAYSAVNQNPTVGSHLTLIGHPIGFPKKFDDDGIVTLTPNTGIINGFVDSYGGNSGSPVFDASGNLVGILVAGLPDFTYDNDCALTNECPGGDGCNSIGETITSICRLFTDSAISSLGVCGTSPSPPSPPPVNGTTTRTASVTVTPKPPPSHTPRPSPTPTAAPNAPRGAQALVTNAYLTCDDELPNGAVNCTDFTSVEEQIALFLDIAPEDVEIISISREHSVAYVQLTVCAKSATLVDFANAILDGELDIGIAQTPDIVIGEAQYESSCPIVIYEEPTASDAATLEIAFSMTLLVILGLLAFAQ